jgi:hypothetical protein
MYINLSLKKQANKEAAEDSTRTFVSILQKKTKRCLDKSGGWFW